MPRIRRRPLFVLPILLGAFIVSACAGPAAAPSAPMAAAPANGGAELTLLKSPTCTCCAEHERYLRDKGLTVRTETVEDIAGVKEAHRIPAEMRSCHTSSIAGYFVEGHVPMAAIDQLLDERPDLDGIALPGMPPGSPGMGGTADGPLTVFGIQNGSVVGVFGEY